MEWEGMPNLCYSLLHVSLKHVKTKSHYVHYLKLFHFLSGIFNGEMFAGKQIETPNVKKRHRRAKSGTKNLDPGQDGGKRDAELNIHVQ